APRASETPSAAGTGWPSSRFRRSRPSGCRSSARSSREEDFGGLLAREPARSQMFREMPPTTDEGAHGRHGVDATGTPLPTSPTRGEVPSGGLGRMVPHTRWSTLPLAGRDGEGGGDELG